MSSATDPPPAATSTFDPEPGSDPAKRSEDLRSAGEALDSVLRDAKRFVERSARQKPGHLVLVVDDAPEVRDLFATELRAAGFRVEQATDGGDAITKATALAPDVIVMDYVMPSMNGGEVARELARNPRTRSIPILLLSSFPDLIPREVRLGCAAFLAKPCAPDEIASLLHLMIAARTRDSPPSVR